MIARLHERLQARLHAFEMTPDDLLERDAVARKAVPAESSANGTCRILRAEDGWVAINLARSEDRDLVPAFGGCGQDDWSSLSNAVATRSVAQVRDQGIELQMPVAILGEAEPLALSRPGGTSVPRKVVDMSALWAGPLCAGLLARAGAQVVRVGSVGRPDPTPFAAPQLHARINGAKTSIMLDLREEAGRAELASLIADADVLVTSARPVALASLGVTHERCAHLTWVAITAYGFAGPGSTRVGFGDDCALAGGLVRWQDGRPNFFGDAIADPLTGLEAAIAVLDGARGLLDFSLAGVAAAWVRDIS